MRMVKATDACRVSLAPAMGGRVQVTVARLVLALRLSAALRWERSSVSQWAAAS